MPPLTEQLPSKLPSHAMRQIEIDKARRRQWKRAR